MGKARFYSPVLSRFIQPDTVVPSPVEPQSWNKYSYTLNNPIKYTDPTGHWVETAFDVVSLGMTINDIKNEGFTFWNTVSLVTDVASIVLPAVPADELESGMHVRQADGDYELVWLEWNVEKEQEMYNFTVDTAHTYFVGEGQWLVHNDCEDVFDELTKMHTKLNLDNTDVLSQLDINGQKIYGVNGPGVNYPKPSGVTYQSLRHAEGDAFGQAISSGIQSNSATLYVDKTPCPFCRNSFAGYSKALGLNELKVYTPSGLYGWYNKNIGKFIVGSQ